MECTVRGSNPVGGDIFRARPDLPWATQPPIQWAQSLSRGESGRGVALTTHLPSSAEVEGRVEIYLCSRSGPSWPLLGWTLLL